MKTLKTIKTLLFIVIFSLFLMTTNQVKANEEDLFEYVSISNGWIEHSSSQTTIPGWKLYGTYDVNGGSGSERTFKIGSSRKSLNDFSHAEFDKSSNGAGNFTSYLKSNSDSPRGFFALAQTFTDLKTDETYTFRVEVEGNAMFEILAYNGTSTSEANNLGSSTKRSIESGTDVFEFSFRPMSSTVTLSMRHYFNTSKETSFTVKNISLGKEIAITLLSMRQQVQVDAVNKVISQYNLDYDFYLEEMPAAIASVILDEVLKINQLNYQDIDVEIATTNLFDKIKAAIEADVSNALSRKLNKFLSDELLIDSIYDEVKGAIRLHLNNLATNLEKTQFVDLIAARIANEDLSYEFRLAEDPMWRIEGKVDGVTNLFPEHTLKLTIPKLDSDYYDKVEIDDLKSEFRIINNEYNLDKTTFTNYKVPVYYVSHVNGDNNNPGTFDSPFYSVTTALGKMDKGIIVLTSVLTFSGGVSVGSGKDILITSSNVDIEKDIPTEFYGIQRLSSSSSASFNLTGGKLTLANIFLEGLRTATDNDGLIHMTDGELVINDGTLIKGGRRTGGGGAIRLNGATNGVVTMNGGEISGNFFTIGTFSPRTNTTFNFFGGAMINNTSDSHQVMNGGEGPVIFGGNFTFKDNFYGTSETNWTINTASKIYIREDFNGEVYLNGNHATYGTEFKNFKIVDMDGNIIDHEQVEFLGFKPVNNKYLHLVYTDDQKFIWDYTYEEERTIITNPTVGTEGIYAKRAITGENQYSNTIYKDLIVLPKLSLEDYYFEYDNFSQTITYTHKNLGLEFVVDVNLNDPNFVSAIIKNPTLESQGLLLTTNPIYPGLEFEAELPTIDSVDYTITTSNHLELTYQIKLDNPHQGSSFSINVNLSDFSDFEVYEKPLINTLGIITGTSHLYPNAVLEITLPELSDTSFYEIEEFEFNNIYTSTNNPYGLELEFIFYTVPIYYIGSTDGVQSNDYPGTFEKPFDTYSYAITKIPTNGKAILVLKNSRVFNSQTTIDNGKTIKLMSSNVDITKEAPTKRYTVSLGNNNATGVFKIESGARLVLENLILDGGLSMVKTSTDALLEVRGEVAINDGTTIKGANRKSGGSAIFLYSNAKFYMYGGEITENYSDVLSAAIGIVSGATNVNLYFLGGSITNNITNNGRAFTSSDNVNYYFGGDFEIHSNYANDLGRDSNTTLTYNNNDNIYIYEDFKGRIDFNDATNPIHVKKVLIHYINEAGEEIDPTGVFFENIRVTQNQDVYLKHDSGRYFLWDYHYEEDVSLVSAPTMDNEGIIGRKAIVGDGVSDDIYIIVDTLPVLSDETFYNKESAGFIDLYRPKVAPCGLDLEFSYYSADIIYVDADVSDSAEQDGSFEKPLKSLQAAIDMVTLDKPGIIVFKNNYLNVNSNHIIADKNIRLMTSNVDITKGIPTTTYTVSLALNYDGSLFKVNDGAYLELENIILDGNRSITKEASGAIIDVENATLVINDKTVIKKGNRKAGGSGVFLYSDAKFYMYGGEITENYSDEKSAAIGIVSGATNVDLYFLGGSITNNITNNGRAFTSSDNVNYYFGGDFEIHSNYANDLGRDSNTTLTYNNNDNIYIYEDFKGRIDFNDATTPIHGQKVLIHYINQAKEEINPTGVFFENIRVTQNQDVYLKHDSGRNFAWDYDYELEASIILAPTLDNEGIIGKKAIVGDGVFNDVYILVDTIPALSDETFYDKESSLFADIYRPKNSQYDLEFSYYLADIFYIDINNGNDTNEGTFENPFKNISAALNKASTSKPAIFVMMNDFLGVKGAYNITDKNIKIMSSNVDITKGKSTEIYTISTLSNITDSLFKLTNATLELENIIIDGKRNLTTPTAGSLIYVYSNSTVIINDGTTLTGGHREIGGSVIFLDGTNIKVIMNGGLITGNYSSANTIALGMTTESEAKAYFLGGKIINNTTKSGAAVLSYYKFDYYFGGDFELHSNYATTLNYDSNMILYYGNKNIHIYDDFYGRIDFNDNSDNLYGSKIPPIKYINKDGVEIDATGVKFLNISPVLDKYLYLKYDDDLGYFIWDYHYAEQYSIVTKPSGITTGLLGRKAIVGGNAQDGYLYSDTIFKDNIILPIITTDKYDYEYDEANKLMTYSYYVDDLEQTFDIEIEILLDDEGFVVIVTKDPTNDEVGHAVATNPLYPGLELTCELPKLSSSLYNVTENDDNITYLITLDHPFDEISFVFKIFSEEFLQDYKDKLDALVEGEPSAAVKNMIDNAKEQIDNALTVLELEQIVANAKDEIELQLAKEAAIKEINDHISTLDKEDYSQNNWQEILNAKSAAINAIKKAEDFDSVEVAKDSGLTAIDAVEKDLAVAKLAAIKEINDYVAGLNRDYYSDENWQLVSEEQIKAIAQINQTVTLEQVDLAIEVGILKINEITTAYDEEFEIQVLIKPTKDAIGQAKANHPNYPNLSFEIDLPILEDERYVVTPSGTKFIYEIDLGAPFTHVTFDYEEEFENLENFKLVTEPTIDQTGLITATSPSYPDQIFEFVLPKLSDDEFYLTIFEDDFKQILVIRDEELASLDLEFIHFKAEIIYVASAKNGGNNNNPGTFLAPVQTLKYAIDQASQTPRLIVLLEDYLLTETHNIAAGKTIKIISSTTDIKESGMNGDPYKVKVQVTGTTRAFYIYANGKLTLENITLDGQQTSAIERRIIEVLGEIIILDGTTITNSGGLVLNGANSPKVFIYGGQIIDNFGYNANTSAIAVDSGAVNGEVHLLGGKIIGNVSVAGRPIYTDRIIIYIGGNHELFGNLLTTENREFGLDLRNHKGIYIYEDFEGRIQLDDSITTEGIVSRSDLIKYIDKDKNVVIPENLIHFYDITNALNEFLHLTYDGQNFRWSYKYDDKLVVDTNPSVAATGLLVRQTTNIYGEVSDVGRIEEVLPKLPNVAYKFVSYDQDLNLAYYEYESLVFGEIVILAIEVDPKDPTFIPVIDEPSLNSNGYIVIESENYPGVRFEQELPNLNIDDYTVTNTIEKITYEFELEIPFVNVSFDLLVDLKDFTYKLVTSPTGDAEGLIIGVSELYSGVEFKVVMPVLGEDEFYHKISGDKFIDYYQVANQVYGILDEFIHYKGNVYYVSVDGVNDTTEGRGSFDLQIGRAHV